jgi:hypothetical protein
MIAARKTVYVQKHQVQGNKNEQNISPPKNNMSIIKSYGYKEKTRRSTWFQAAPAQAQTWHKDIPLRLKLWKQSQCLEAWALRQIQGECSQRLIRKIN